MDISAYTTLTRQSGLMREMHIIANNIANAATTGYRQQQVLFSEYLSDVGSENLSMAHANIANTDFSPGVFSQTGNPFDLAIEGAGFFMLETDQGPVYTRNGNFTISADNMLVAHDGAPVLDVAGAPVFIPVSGSEMAIGQDGTLSFDGQILGQIAVVEPQQGTDIVRQDGVRFLFDGDAQPAQNARLLQGSLEKSNADPVGQMARMIDVQRAYEMAQSFIENEDKRIRSVTNNILS